MPMRFGIFRVTLYGMVLQAAIGIERRWEPLGEVLDGSSTKMRLMRREADNPLPANGITVSAEPNDSKQPLPASVAQPKDQATADAHNDFPGSPPMKLILKCCSTTPRQATALQKQTDGKWTVSCRGSGEAGETQASVDATCGKVIQQVAETASLAEANVPSAFNDETDQSLAEAVAASDVPDTTATAASETAGSETPGAPPPEVLRECCKKEPKEVPVATKSPSGSFEYGCLGTSANVLKQDEIERICSDNAGEAAGPLPNSSAKPKKVPRKILDHHTMNMNPPAGGSEQILAPPEVTEKCCMQTPKKMPVASKSEDGEISFICKGTKEGARQKQIIEACLAFEVSPWRKTNLPAPSLELVKSCCGKKEQERPVEHYWPSGAVTYSCEGVTAGWSMNTIVEVCANMTKCAERYPVRDTPDGALSKQGNQGRFPPPKPDLVLACCSKVPRECPVPKLEATGSYSYACSGKNSNMTESAILETCEYLAIDSQVFQPPAPHPCEISNCTSIDVRVPPAAIVTKCCKNDMFPIGVPTNDGSLTFTCVGESTGLSKAQIEDGCKKYSQPKKDPKPKSDKADA